MSKPMLVDDHFVEELQAGVHKALETLDRLATDESVPTHVRKRAAMSLARYQRAAKNLTDRPDTEHTSDTRKTRAIP